MKYLWILLISIPLFGQTTYTEAEALEMIKQRDAQWEGKIEKADLLIASQKVLITDYEGLVGKLEDQANVDSSLLVQKDEQIALLMEQNWALEKQADLAKPRWYENKWLYFAYGSAAIIIPTYLGIKIVEVAN
ncbi:hypothetical protein [uncultured Mediterranean phage]|nr:hypothetical protein [uncultured Mediterranean phage]